MYSINLVHIYLISPLHTGGTTQEGNLLGIARESHTQLPYIPSSTIRGRLRASVDDDQRTALFGPTLNDNPEANLTQGALWVGDGSLLWVPVPSLSHGVVWISSPLLLRRWLRLTGKADHPIPGPYSTTLPTGKPVYLKDAIFRPGQLKLWPESQEFLPIPPPPEIERVLLLPDAACATLIQMSLWRQVKVKLDEHKSVEGGSFRYEEAIPPDTLMYFPWGINSQATQDKEAENFQRFLEQQEMIQLGGQESLGRGFVQLCHSKEKNP